MILDIQFKDKAPSQYQGVRMTTVYTQKTGSAFPEIVLHFYAFDRPQLNLSLASIVSITTTND